MKVSYEDVVEVIHDESMFIPFDHSSLCNDDDRIGIFVEGYKGSDATIHEDIKDSTYDVDLEALAHIASICVSKGWEFEYTVVMNSPIDNRHRITIWGVQRHV